MAYPGGFSISVPVYGPAPQPSPAVRGTEFVRRATIDAAQTTNQNRKHWAAADGLAPVSQLTPQVRQVLRNRARLECLNNCYAQGAVRTLVNDTVGRGPRLQMLTSDEGLNRAVEDLWRDWAAATDFSLNMRVMAGVRYVAGECFATYRDSKQLDRLGHPVTLDIRLIEPDQVAHPWGETWLDNPTGDDGIECDADGEVVSYHVLRAHPGDHRRLVDKTRADSIRAEDILHWFVRERPGQLRGLTPFTPALDIFAQLRRFTKATLTAAEFAAMLAGIMEQEVPPDGGNFTVESMDYVEMVMGMLLTLPPGAKAHQFKPEHPATTYEMFVAAKLRECGRALNIPFGKMAGDHSKYNYSSGRLDDASYWTEREIERQALEAKVFNPVFHRWCDFARFALPALATFKGKWWQLKHAWHYDARPSSDPVRDATGDELNLTNGADTLASIAARDGTTVEALLDQRAREMRMFAERGLPIPPWLSGAPAPARTPQEEQPQEDRDRSRRAVPAAESTR